MTESLFSFCFDGNWNKLRSKFLKNYATFGLIPRVQVENEENEVFSNFSCMFLNPNIFSNLNSHCSTLLDSPGRSQKSILSSKNSLLKEIVLVISASTVIGFSRSLEHFFLTVGENNFGNKIPLSIFDNSARHFESQDRKSKSLLIRVQMQGSKVKVDDEICKKCRWVGEEI